MPNLDPLPTVQVTNPETYHPMTINEADYNPDVHVLWVEPEPEPEPELEPKPVIEPKSKRGHS